MGWRLAHSLEILRDQINKRWPNRRKDSDGSVGNAEHSARESDHNPDTDGVVKAIDITHDPAGGCDSYRLAEALRSSRDERIKYLISNRRICSGTGQDKPAWVWRPYSGANPHNHHVHISVKKDASHYDNTRSWNLDAVLDGPLPTGSHPDPAPPTLRQGMGGIDVTKLQRTLGMTADGEFGPATAAAVKQFQATHGLVADGIVGPQTWAALKAQA